MATLLVQEAMGFKVDREAVAAAVLPQLWQMAMGPCTPHSFLIIELGLMRFPTVLNVEQFRKFMSVIKKLGDRVEREHNQFLRDSQRLEDRSTVPVDGVVSSIAEEVSFENLVGQGDGVTVKQDTAINGSSKGWDEDDVWGSIFSNDETVGVCPFLRDHPDIFTPLGFFPRHSHRHFLLHRLPKRHPYRRLRWSRLMQHYDR